MNKRIFRAMSLLIFFVTLFFAVLWCIAFSGAFGSQARESLKVLRVSIIDNSGNVIFDNMADTDDLENHLARPEVIDATQKGVGESKRFSDTLGETTYYYAKRLENKNILRLALTTNSIKAMLYAFIPVVVICLILAAGFAFMIARKLTRSIIAPINNINLDEPDLGNYDELLPLVKKIETQKKELSAQLMQIESRSVTIEAITENMKEGLLLLDESGKVLLSNGSVLEILSLQDEVFGNVIEVCRNAEFLEQAKACLSGKKSEMLMHIGEKIFNIFFSPVSDGVISGAIILFIDVTERHMAEAQRKEFSANVSHELKTPLTTITALSEMIANGTAKDKDIRPFADKIKNQSKRLIDIIEDIIKLSEFDEGEKSKEFTRFNLYDIAEEVISSLSERAENRNIFVTLKGDYDKLSIRANMRMIDELLYNLLDNAIKYNRDGGSVSVTLAEDGEYVLIEVVDNGIGIPPEHTERIFERFYCVDKSRSKKTGGTGLGLSIVKHISEFHGGYVAVESSEDIGTSFIVRIQKS